MEAANEDKKEQGSKLKNWIRKVGIAGFFFFLFKGLVWIAIFMGAGSLI